MAEKPSKKKKPTSKEVAKAVEQHNAVADEKSKIILPGQDAEAEASVKLDGETQDAGDVIVMPEPEETEFEIVAVRIAEWCEWLPKFPDQATAGVVGVANGSTALQTLKGEKLAEIKANAVPGQDVKRKVKMGDEEVEITFALYMYQATLVQLTADKQMPDPMLIHKPGAPSNIVRATAMPPAPPNRKQRRSR
jgi:hypothetical protein